MTLPARPAPIVVDVESHRTWSGTLRTTDTAIIDDASNTDMS